MKKLYPQELTETVRRLWTSMGHGVGGLVSISLRVLGTEWAPGLLLIIVEKTGQELL